MMKVIIVGGGWSGCAAALTAKKAGAEVHVYEKTDLLLGLGNVGGIMRNNGRYTASGRVNCIRWRSYWRLNWICSFYIFKGSRLYSNTNITFSTS